MPTLAHLSDLHMGAGRRPEIAARALCQALLQEGIDHAVVTGDVTHRGTHAQRAAFERAFAPLLDAGRLTVLPGNHDRQNDEVGLGFLAGKRLVVVERPGLYLVAVDSTGPHNRSYVNGHGLLTENDLARLDAALAARPRDGALIVVALHHHPLPLPEEGLHERLVTWLGLPIANELPLGWDLIESCLGRCDLILHGHRHVPGSYHIANGDPPLAVYNAGQSTGLGAVRVFEHRAGALVGGPRWLCTGDAMISSRGPARDRLSARSPLALAEG